MKSTDDEKPSVSARARTGLLDLSGRVVVVTGGNSGIGFGIAKGVVRAGGSVTIWARRPDRNERAVRDLIDMGGSAASYICDVADEGSVDACMTATIERFGRIDALVANAGTSSRYRFADMPLEAWRQVLSVNLDGAFLCLRTAAARLIQQGVGGALVGVSSTASIHGAPGQEHYAASKTAILAVMRSLAVELARYNIRCNSLVPGWTNTELTAASRQNQKFLDTTTQRTPIRRWATPEDFEVVGAFLCDPTIRFHTGDAVVVDGGYTVF